jgi:hypothetical protein
MAAVIPPKNAAPRVSVIVADIAKASAGDADVVFTLAKGGGDVTKGIQAYTLVLSAYALIREIHTIGPIL